MIKPGIGPSAAGTSLNTVTPGDRVASMLPYALLVAVLVGVIYYVMVSVHWLIACDTPIMHYVTFLMRHGLRPYIDISDNNMPGSYYTEALAMRIFGPGDLAWRLYDFLLLTTLTVGLTVIAKPYHWLAGVFAGGMFIILNGVDGPGFAVEREEVLTVLLVLGYVAMFRAVRRHTPLWMVFLGLTCGVAASIKPTFLPLPFALMALMAFVLRRRGIPAMAFLGWALLGFIAVFAFDIGYLRHYHVIKPFLFIVRTVSPTYVALIRQTPRQLTALIFPRNMRVVPVLVVLTALSMWRRHVRWTWEKWAIAVGAAFGLFSFFVQGKGFQPQRYTFLVLFLLLAGFELLDGLRQRGWPRALASLTLLLIVAWIIPGDMRSTPRRDWRPDPLDVTLQHLGGAETLQGKVQCFDMVFGCFGSLYHLGLVENSGFTGDLLFFTKKDTVASLFYKNWFWQQARKDPATVLVVTNEWLGQDGTFDRLKTWPDFSVYLGQNYTLVLERHFLSTDPTDPNPNRFRIYVRNGTPLLAKAEQLSSAGKL